MVRLGAIPRLVDIDDTYCMDPKDLKRKLELSEGRAKAVLLVHMSGACGDVQAIVDVCRQHNVLLIEDVAEVHDACVARVHVTLFVKRGCAHQQTAGQRRHVSWPLAGIVW